MKAVILEEFGDVDKLLNKEVKDPVPGPGEVLVQVKACGVNHLDLWVRKGIPSYRIKLPHISGSEISGVVVQCGDGVSHLKTGERVVVYPGISDWTCDECLSGANNECLQYRLIGAQVPGGYAELISVPAINLYPVPQGLSFVEASAIPLVFTTAWHLLIHQTKLHAGEDVLILAGGSGIGSAGIQIAKLAGARVFTTASTTEKLEHAKQLGADFVINYTQVDFSEEVRRLTNGRGVDIVFEHVGEDTFEKSINSLARNGRLAICGATTGANAHFDIRQLYSRQLSVIGSMSGTLYEFRKVIDLAGEKKLHPVIDRQFPLKDAAQAQQLMEQRRFFGKLVLVMD